MDALLSAFPENGTLVLLLGDFNLLLGTPQASAFLPLLQSFDFTVAESASTDKAGNLLDLVFTRKLRKSKSPVALTDFHTLLATLFSNLSSAKSAFFLSKIQSSVSNPQT
ncbi:hypothetical protein AAFF_G00323470, partial [Aldrovandia affinis]